MSDTLELDLQERRLIAESGLSARVAALVDPCSKGWAIGWCACRYRDCRLHGPDHGGAAGRHRC